MLKYLISISFIIFSASSCLFAQNRIEPEKIKAQKIRTATKITIDLKMSNNFSSQPVNTILYDEDGLQVENIKYDYNGEIEIRYIYKHDNRDNVIEVTGRRPDGSLANKWAYEYDENNNLIRQTSFRQDGLIGRDYHFTYDENGIRQSELIYNDKQLIEKSEYIFEFYGVEN